MARRGIAFILSGLLLGGCMQATLDQASDANLTPRDRKLLANAPYARVMPPPEYQRAVVEYHRKEAPGSIVIDTDARYLYYVLADNKAIRYGAAAKKHYPGTALPRSAARKSSQPGPPRQRSSGGSGNILISSEGGPLIHGARGLCSYAGSKTPVPHSWDQPARAYQWPFVGMHPRPTRTDRSLQAGRNGCDRGGAPKGRGLTVQRASQRPSPGATLSTVSRGWERRRMGPAPFRFCGWSFTALAETRVPITSYDRARPGDQQLVDFRRVMMSGGQIDTTSPAKSHDQAFLLGEMRSAQRRRPCVE